MILVDSRRRITSTSGIEGMVSINTSNGTTPHANAAPLRRRKMKTTDFNLFGIVCKTTTTPTWWNASRWLVASSIVTVMGFVVVILYALLCWAMGSNTSFTSHYIDRIPGSRLASTLSILRESSRSNHRNNMDQSSSMLTAPIQACQTLECQERLEHLQSKLVLEEEIYQEMYQKELQRTRELGKELVQYDRKDMIERLFHQIRVNAKEAGKERYVPDSEWLHKSHPELCVVGNLKTGTSQLYNILATHRDVQRIEHDSKEHCASNHISKRTDDDEVPRTLEYGLHSWHKYYYKHYHETRPRVNGCVAWKYVERHFVYSPPSPDTKFFVLLRDPAEWAWAAYNFWCDDAWEEDGQWVNETLHYRSPEVFHEVMLSGGKLIGSQRMDDLRQDSVTVIRRLMTLVGKRNLVILKNEDLTPDRIHVRGGALDRISEATKLAKDGFNKETLHSRSNCNAHKGYGAKCTEESHKSGGYPVTHNRPMLEATRRFIYLQWHAECKIWAEEFGIVYPRCLEAIDDSETQEVESL